MLKWVLHLIVMALVAAITANYYHAGGAGYGYAVHPYIYYGVGAVVAFLPVFWAITHVCGGLLLGLASGGVMDGLRLGLMLGTGMALSKLWPASLGAAAGIYLGDGPRLYMYGLIAVGVLLFALDRALHYFWHTTTRE
jgi:hypothetical protein